MHTSYESIFSLPPLKGGGGPAKLVEGVLRETPYIISPPEISTT